MSGSELRGKYYDGHLHDIRYMWLSATIRPNLNSSGQSEQD